MLELLRGNVYIYLQLPMIAVGSSISLQKRSPPKRASTPSLEECADTFGYDNQGNSS
ncbi:hypothetical protein LC612_29965 [Nostoc sp. CHAB 5834]|nr:hypothetical protein [Nostoc sp. CHAB 5834]